MKKLVLHIGRHKTGTTSVQAFLAEKAEILRAEGACYPEAGRWKRAAGISERDCMAHHDIALKLASPADNGDALVGIRDALMAEAEGCDTVILSSEAFQNLPSTEPVRDLFADFEIQVVCYLREYLAYVMSAYQQEIKNSGRLVNLSHFEERFYLDLHAFMAQWTKISHSAIWRLYERERLVNCDIVADFVEAIGLPIEADGIARDLNVSIGGSLLGFKTILNMLDLHSPEHVDILEDLAQRDRRFSGAFRVSPEEQERIRRANPCNKILRELFGEISLRDFRNCEPIFGASFPDDFRTFLDAYSPFPEVTGHPVIAAMRRGFA